MSSGCVRLKRPLEIADFIMRGRKGWSDARMQTILDSHKTKDLFIRDVIPVYIVYYTTWINEQDQVVYGRDLYEYDDKLIKMLSDLDEIFIPVDNN